MIYEINRERMGERMGERERAFMKNHVYSWYLGTAHPRKLQIGPKGYDCADWRELQPVATPVAYWCNAFYMDAEMRCVLNRHDLEMHFDSRSVKGEREKIHYTNISYEVPGHPFSDSTKHQLKEV